jgi:hypothetical protein
MLLGSGLGCAQTRHPCPVELIRNAEISGFPGVRGWWERPGDIENTLRTAVETTRKPPVTIAATTDNSAATAEPGDFNILCMSGGGPGGAFGAGLLCGWTQAGTRPKFQWVTGISTGALISPFAFLGPEYDHVLTRLCAGISTRDVLQRRPLVSLAFGAGSLADSAPLARLIEECVDDSVVAAVAREHATGRRLLIGTTHMDAGRLVVWDMGAIASSPRPDAPALFRKVMLASASIPVALPPQYFQVEIDGRHYDEMHVDGGVVAEMFLYGVGVDAPSIWEKANLGGRHPRLYVIRNGYLRSPARPIRPELLSIAERAVFGLLDGKATGDVFHIYTLARRDGLEFNLAYVPENFVIELKEPFDPLAMSRLFTLGHNLARDGYPWQKAPPGLDPPPTDRSLLVQQ